MSTEEYFPTERRRHPRTHLQMSLHGIRLDPDGGDVINTLSMLDISKGGMGAVSDRAFYPGQRIVLYLPLPGGATRRNIYATVVRCRQCHDGDGYRVGLEFDNVYTDAWCGVSGIAAAA